MQTFYSNGKLLITAEYLVLFGAKALALPTKKGQSLEVSTTQTKKINWQSFDSDNKIWLQTTFSILDVTENNENSNDDKTNTLIEILHQTYKQNPEFWLQATGFDIKTNLFFDRNWGLGSSSTLLNNISNWVNVNPYQILKNTFTGSGYDLACAKHNTPILYQLINSQPIVEEINFNPPFRDHLYFVYLNQKQSSKQAIKDILNNVEDYSSIIKAIDCLTQEIINAKNLHDFKLAINSHEDLISNFLNQPKVKDLLFSDFNGSIKSLGAWGGDFVLVASNENPASYFESKGYKTIISYKDMIL